MTSTTIVAQQVRRSSLAKKHPAVLMASLGALAVLLSFYGLSVGATEVSLGDVLRALVGDTSTQASQIVVQFQLPRVLLCWLVGTALAVSGGVIGRNYGSLRGAGSALRKTCHRLRRERLICSTALRANRDG